MIKTITIKNFKSIQNDTVHLEPLTVLVGANGAGKSNFVKSFEFIGLIPEIGLASTVNKFGGFNSLVPKAYHKNEITKKTISISLQTEIFGRKTISENSSKAFIDYCIEIRKPSALDPIRVLKEEILFQNLLAFESDDPHLFRLEIKRGQLGGRKYVYDDGIFEIRNSFNMWMRLSQGEKRNLSIKKKTDYLNLLTSKGKIESYQSFLDPNELLLFSLRNQGSLFKNNLKEIRRFDFLLSKLRSEQSQGNPRRLTSSGDNLASVLRGLLSDKNDKPLNRIKNTLSRIAPNFAGFETNSLRTGKEFVEFVEQEAQRFVESWESSDGILRALAILLALETQSTNSTLLIEEPEQNLHPWAITAIFDHVREVIDEKKIQVVITTHSQQVLECVHPQEVLFAKRVPKMGTKFLTLNQIFPGKELFMGEIGRLWVQGLLAGIPSND